MGEVSVGGRPTIYSEDLADLICERLACGESMRAISRDEALPAMTTLFRWLRTIPEFKQQYAQAKEESAHALFEDMMYIADYETGQPVMVDGLVLLNEDKKPVLTVDAASIGHAKLRIDTRKWHASKLMPKKYGDKPDEGNGENIAEALNNLADKLPS